MSPSRLTCLKVDFSQISQEGNFDLRHHHGFQQVSTVWRRCARQCQGRGLVLFRNYLMRKQNPNRQGKFVALRSVFLPMRSSITLAICQVDKATGCLACPRFMKPDVLTSWTDQHSTLDPIGRRVEKSIADATKSTFGQTMMLGSHDMSFAWNGRNGFHS